MKLGEKTRFTDCELTAYLDGEYDYCRHQEIEGAIAQDQALRQRLEGLSINMKSLSQAFDLLIDMAPACPVEQSGKSLVSSWKA